MTAVRRWGGGHHSQAVVALGTRYTLPIALDRSADHKTVAALCTDPENDDPKKPRGYSVYWLNYGNLNAKATISKNARIRLADKDTPVGVDVRDDGGVLICGHTYTNATKQWSTVAARLTATGAEVWKHSQVHSETTTVFGCAQTPAGDVVAGRKKTTIAGTTVNSIWLQVRNSVGNVAWEAKYKPSSGDTYARDIIPVAGGFAAGGRVNNQQALLRFDGNGNLVGDKRFGGDLRQWKAMPTGGFVAAGVNAGKPYIVRTDAFGNAPCDKVGKCAGKKFSDCDDKNPCTVDTCVADKGCTNVELDDGVVCGADDNACTEDAKCVSSKCQAPALVKDGSACEDGNPCTLAGACKTGKCTPGAAKAEFTVCDDGSQCIKNGRCDASAVCYGVAVCNDNKPCTLDKCKAGACTYVPIVAGGACDDGDICTETSTCDKDGKCSGKDECTWKTLYNEPFDCGSAPFNLYGAKNGVGWAVDGTPSTPGYKSKDCSFNTNNGTTYGTESFKLDARHKTEWKLPQRGRIVARYWSYYGTKDAAEAQQDRRTVNPYINGSGKWLILLTDALDLNKWYEREIDLTHLPNRRVRMRFVHQSDGDANTGAGWFVDDYKILQGTPKKGFPCRFSSECNDGLRCTADECVDRVCKWTNIPEGGACDDGDVCTEKDVCDKAGVCKGPVAKTCNDGDPCTVDKCAANRSGCYAEPGNHGTTCDDKDACTTSDKCTGGVCRGTSKCNDGNPCTWESCNSNGTCKKTNVTRWTPCGGGRQCNGSGACLAQNGGWGLEASSYYRSVCAVRANGELWCWGYNSHGEFGNGTQTASLVPVKATVPGKVLDFDMGGSGGSLSCAVIEVASVRDTYCWGGSSSYSVGVATKSSGIYTTPNKVGGTTGAVQVAVGGRHACTLFEDGGVGCHGSGYSGTTNGSRAPDTPTPNLVPGIKTAVQIATTGYATCALLADRTVSCWGTSGNGELGRGFRSNSAQKPGLVTGLKDVVRVSGGQRHFCAATTKREVWCWGDNQYGKLGDGTTTRRESPVRAATNMDERAVLGLGMHNTCAMATNDYLKCWGRGNEGQIGNRKNSSISKIGPQTYGGHGIRAIGKFYYTPCSVQNTGKVFCWGEGSLGQIGNNAKVDRNQPTQVNGT